MARGRPFYICPEVEAWSCSCSFGMPSSHSCTGVSVYFIMYLLIVEFIKKEKSCLKISLGIFCFLMAFGIGLSRIILGSHSYNQVIVGVTLGVLWILIFSQETFHFFVKEKILKKKVGGLMALGYFLLTGIICLITYATNKGKKRNRSFWIERDECPDCLDKLVYKQMDNNTHFLLTFGILIGFVLNYKFFGEKKSEIFSRVENDSQDVEESNGNNSGIKKFLSRFLVYLLLMGILGLIYLGFSAVFNLKDGLTRFLTIGFIYFLGGFSTIFLVQLIWSYIGIDDIGKDYVSLK